MKWNPTKYAIYLFLTGRHPHGGGKHFTCPKIASFLEVSGSYVRRVRRELLDEGYITRDTKPFTPQIYSRTKKSVEDVFRKDEETLTQLSPKELEQLTQDARRRVFTTAKTRWSVAILGAVPEHDERFTKYWKKSLLRNNVKQYEKKWLFGEPVNCPLSFSIVGKKNWTMTVTMPRWVFDTKEHFMRAEDIIGDYARSALKQMAQRYHMNINTMDVYKSSGELEHPLRESDIKKFIDTAQIIIKYHHKKKYIGKLSFDGSGKVDRIEADKYPQWIANYAEIPFFNTRITEMEKQQKIMLETQKEMMEQQQSQMEEMQASMNRMEQMLSQPKKKLTPHDMEMYG
jgi:hypothetical protein